MNKLRATITRIIRVHCDSRGCTNTYDYSGPKSSSFALTEAEAFDWKQRGVWFVCPDHAEGPIER